MTRLQNKFPMSISTCTIEICTVSNLTLLLIMRCKLQYRSGLAYWHTCFPFRTSHNQNCGAFQRLVFRTEPVSPTPQARTVPGQQHLLFGNYLSRLFLLLNLSVLRTFRQRGQPKWKKGEEQIKPDKNRHFLPLFPLSFSPLKPLS